MQSKTKRILKLIAAGGLGALLLVLALRSAAVAVWATEADETNAPLALERSTVDIQAVSDWIPVVEDAYDGTYAATHEVPRAITAGGAPYRWGRVISAANPFSDTLWCAQGGQGSALDAGVDPYPPGVTTTVTYGPIDMRKVVTVALSFRHWISTADGDGLAWSVSAKGVPQNFVPVVPTLEGAWETTTLNSDFTAALAQLPGRQSAYLAFRFVSNGDGQVGPGVFMDDVQLWTRTYTRLHLPLLIRPEVREGYVEDFSDVHSGWPREWERKGDNVNIRGGYLLDRTRAQVWEELMASRDAGDMSPLELEAARTRFLAAEDEVYYAVLHDAWDRAFVSGPYQAEGDFDLEVRARYNYAQKWFDGNRYGVMLTQEKVNPEDPHSIHGYSFQVEINPKDDGDSFETAWWRFKEWYRTNWQGDDGGDEDRTMADDPSGAIRSALGDWNTLRIERRGKEFRLYINGTYVRTVSDDDNTGPLYVGLIGRHTGSGTTELSYDVLYEWDDLTVTLR